ncbi:MAG: hypothetical protein WAM89_07100, partial [Terriglobales bacterium]
MPTRLRRAYGGYLHFITFSCYQRRVPQVRVHSYNPCGFHFSGFGALTWAGGFLKPSDNLEFLGHPRLACLRLRGTWGT